MKKLFLFLIAVNCFGLDIGYIQKAMNNKEYSKVCQDKVFKIAKLKNDSGLMNMYGIACLKLDYIIKLNPVITALISTPESRNNAVYFTTILYKKKLLYSALIDGLDIGTIKLPKCDYILSDIYDDYVDRKYMRDGDKYIFSINGNKYEVGISKDTNPKIIVKIFNEENNVIEIKEYR